jgi:STE24 endopeptidase
VSPVRRSEGFQVATTGVLALVCAELATRILAPRRPIPPPQTIRLPEFFSSEEIARARRYQRPQVALGLAAATLDLATLGWVLRRSRRPSRTRRGPLSTRAAVLGSAAYAAGLAGGLSLPGLPFAALARRRSVAIGLSTQTWSAWLEDLAKATAIQSVLAAGGGAAVMAATRRWPRGWWLVAAGGSVGFGAGLAALAPVLLDPVFNDFTPLPESETRRDVLELASAAGVRVGQVFSVDASRRTTAVNAYVTGLGPTKRVVLFDTLIDNFSREEVRVVVAHELGHVRHRDVLRSVALAALTAPASALAVQRLSWALSPARAEPRALPALALAAGLVSATLGVLASRLSRQVERQADAFSLELSNRPDAFISFEQKIVRRNVADPAPPRLLNLLASHPPTDQRIGAALAYAGRAASKAAH